MFLVALLYSNGPILTGRIISNSIVNSFDSSMSCFFTIAIVRVQVKVDRSIHVIGIQLLLLFICLIHPLTETFQMDSSPYPFLTISICQMILTIMNTDLHTIFIQPTEMMKVYNLWTLNLEVPQVGFLFLHRNSKPLGLSSRLFQYHKSVHVKNHLHSLAVVILVVVVQALVLAVLVLYVKVSIFPYTASACVKLRTLINLHNF